MGPIVFIGYKVADRVEVLRNWASNLTKYGRFIIDIPHPHRHLSVLYIGPPFVPHALILVAYKICNIIYLDDCRIYARDLATAAGLQALNTMRKSLRRPKTVN